MSMISSLLNAPSFSRSAVQVTPRLPSAKVGMDLLRDADVTKGSAYTREERDRLHLRGLLPHKVFTQDEQVARIRRQFELMPTPLLKYIFLSSERERNSQAFWRFLFTHPPTATMPILYTPTVGEACQKWATHRNNYRGIYITPEDRGHIKDILRNYPNQDVRCIVVTDGGRILGLGDQGASGLGIPVGKLVLYTLIGQVDPKYTLPVQLDIGTDRKELLDDPLYHGYRAPRLRGEAHTALVQEFVDAVKEVFGSTCLVQFEDFEMNTAFHLLDHFRWRCNCFNDDIEGTASVAAAAVATAARIKGVPALKDQKIIFIGAGSAATGIANLIAEMAASSGKITKEQMQKNIIMFDHKGMVRKGRKDLFFFNEPYLHDIEEFKSVNEAVRKFKATAVIGVSGCPGLINEEMVKDLCKNAERPIVFALSNPTSKAECSAQQAYEWSDRKALFASGSPFPDYNYQGHRFIPAQANNSWIFPAVGFALVTTRARHCPEKVFQVAAEALASLVKEEDLEMSNLLPPLDKIREYSFGIAIKVAQYLIKEELATVLPPKNVSLESWMKEQLFLPDGKYAQQY